MADMVRQRLTAQNGTRRRSRRSQGPFAFVLHVRLSFCRWLRSFCLTCITASHRADSHEENGEVNEEEGVGGGGRQEKGGEAGE